MPRRLTLTLALTVAAPAALAGAATGGATEVTQIANRILLLQQVGESVQTTAHTLSTAQATMQMLRALPQGAIAEMTQGLPLEKVQELARSYQVMNRAAGDYKAAAAVLQKAQDDAQKLGITPSELLRYKADAAARHGGIYRETYEQEQAKLQRLARTSAEVQKQADTIQGIDSNVGGLQALASQNVQVQAALAEISSSIATANANAALAAEQEQAQQQRRAHDESRFRDARAAAAAAAPGAGPLRLPHEQQLVNP